MENVTVIFYIASAVLGFLSAGLPSIVAICRNIKNRKNLKTEAEKATADLEIKNHMLTLIGEAEEIYATVDTALKSIGGSAGAVKKETVMSRLREFALDSGFTFDKEKWSTEIDAAVAMTKTVNSK